MEKSIVKRILKLNKDFYQRYGKSFSLSRQTPWKGWFELIGPIETVQRECVRVLDLGSGNGRFYSFLNGKLTKKFDYLGLDCSDSLLAIAKEKYGGNSNFTQLKADVILGLDKIPGSYDLVVAFGVTHHIPSSELREAWFSQLSDLIAKSGLLIITFWNKSGSSLQKVPGITEDDMDKGDSFLGWEGKKDAVRYVHFYSDLEINDVINLLTKNKLIITKKFISDVSAKSSNNYLIFKKL